MTDGDDIRNSGRGEATVVAFVTLAAFVAFLLPVAAIWDELASLLLELLVVVSLLPGLGLMAASLWRCVRVLFGATEERDLWMGLIFGSVLTAVAVAIWFVVVSTSV